MIEQDSMFWSIFIALVFIFGIFAGWLILALTRCTVKLQRNVEQENESTESNFGGSVKGA